MDFIVQLILNSVIATSAYALIAISFVLIYNVTKFFNISHGIVAAIGGYGAFYYTNSLDLPFSIAMILGVITAGVFGYLLNALIYKPFRNKGASSTILLVVSFGVFIVVETLLAAIFTGRVIFYKQSFEITKVYEVFGGFITQPQLYTLITLILVSVFLWLFLRYTHLGKSIKAVSHDVEVAKMVGINTDKVIGYVFFIGSAIAGLTGILIGLDVGLTPDLWFVFFFKSLIASIVGGFGSLFGAGLGSALLGFAENFGIWKLSGEWKDAIAFLILIIFLIFRPQGIIKK